MAATHGAFDFSTPLRRIFAAVCMLLASAPAFAASELRAFDIPAQPLGKALLQFGLQADISISLSGLDLAGKTSRAVNTTGTTESVLRQLLEGSGFGFAAVDAGTFRIVVLPAPPAPPPPRPIRAIRAQAPDEIIVTAAKRRETLQDAAYSVASVSGDATAWSGVKSLDAATGLVASLNSTNQGAGRNKYFIRGLSDGAFNGRIQSTVGIYLDETRITFNAPDPSLQLIDIDRIEVVRGPQGTLYGAGSLGGVVRIITKHPRHGAWEENVSAGIADIAHGTSSREIAGMMNVPLAGEAAAVRAVVYAKQDGGFIDDRGIGTDNINRTDISGVRTEASFEFGDAWTVLLGGFTQEIDSKNTQYFDRAQPRYTRTNRISEPHDNDFGKIHLTVEGEMGWGTISSSTAWLNHAITSRYDASLALPILAGQPIQPAAYDEKSKQRTFYHETRVVSASDQDLRWLVGAFATHLDQTFNTRLGLVNTFTPSSLYQEHRVDDGDEFAAFGELTYALSPATEVTAGARLYRGVIDANSFITTAENTPRPEAIGHNVHNGITPKIKLAWRPTPRRVFYAEVAQGFRLGGVDIDTPAPAPIPREDADKPPSTVTNLKSDSLWNYELGAKTTWLDDRLILNGAVFYALWRNVQSDQLRNSGLPFSTNVGTVRNRGLEIDAQFSVTKNLVLSAHLMANSPDLTGPGTPTEADHLPVVPRLSAGETLHFLFPLRGDLIARLDVNHAYVSKSRLTFNTSGAPDMGGYHIGRIGLSVARDSWEVTAYVNNIGNAVSNSFSYGNPFSLRSVSQVTPPNPRTIGLSVSWRS